MTELGGDYFVRSLQEFIRSSERKIADLSFDNAELSSKVAQLESIVDAKDRIIKEYLKRVALLEFSLRKAATTGGGGAASLSANIRIPESAPLVQPPELSTRAIVRAFLDELDMNDGLEDIEAVEQTTMGDWEPVSVLRSSLIGAVRGVAFSDYGFFTAGDDGIVKIWTDDLAAIGEIDVDIKNVSLVQNTVTPHLSLRRSGRPITSLGSDGDLVVSGDEAGGIAVYKIKKDSLRKEELFPSYFDQKKLVELELFSDKLHSCQPINSVVASATESFVVSGGNDGTIVVSCLDGRASTLHSGSVTNSLGLIRDSPQIVAGMANGEMLVFDLLANKPLRESAYGQSSVLSLCVVPESSLVCLAQADGTVSLVDLRSDSVVQSNLSLTAATCIAATAPRMAVGAVDGSVGMYDMRNLTAPVAVLWSNAHNVVKGEGTIALDFSQDGKMLTSAGAEGKVNVYRLK